MSRGRSARLIPLPPNDVAIPDKLYFRIGEVSELTRTKAFVLRYWETEFPTLKPVKSPKGHRLYRREDVNTVLRIKRLLYDEGFTIAGARRHLADPPALPNGGDGAPNEMFSGIAEGSTMEQSASNGHALMESSHPAAPALASSDAHVIVERETLLELRDALRSFLTLLENE